MSPGRRFGATMLLSIGTISAIQAFTLEDATRFVFAIIGGAAYGFFVDVMANGLEKR